jgi:hypothetical protein
MQILNQENFVDKTAWKHRGEWDNEPDRVEWRSETSPIFPCLIVRGGGGALCGYVGVGKDHPYYQKDYDTVNADIEVHGGLTFSNERHEGGKICHTPIKGESDDDLWWLGFDCSHLGDRAPVYEYCTADTYRNIAYVIDEVNYLASQLARKLNN